MNSYEIRVSDRDDILTGDEYVRQMVGNICTSGVYWGAINALVDEGVAYLWVTGEQYDWDDKEGEYPSRYWYRMKLQKVRPECGSIPDYEVRIDGGSENAIDGLANSEYGYGLETRSPRTAVLAAFSMIDDIHAVCCF